MRKGMTMSATRVASSTTTAIAAPTTRSRQANAAPMRRPRGIASVTPAVGETGGAGGSGAVLISGP